jgi:2-keto-4-pentenoate hydratase/2-oxohepta-3-ene-1,7-dioic acid hydratase in catechol pathway
MKLLAIADGKDRVMAVCRTDDSTAVPLLAVEDFYSDPARGLAHARERLATAGDADAVDVARSTLVPFVPVTARVFCLGLNYSRHADEAGRTVATIPEVFGRWYSTLVTTGAQVPAPPREPGLDWEGEFAVIVGQPVYDSDADEAADAFLGYTCFLDLSARTYQRATRHVTLGKNADRSGPIGPVLVTADEFAGPRGLHLQTRVNGKVMQDGSTSEMIFSPADIAAYISGVIRLLPGDVIATGTPEGVGITRDPPVYLTPGDDVEVEIEKIGVLRASVCAFS